MLQNGQETALEAQEGGLWQCPDFCVKKTLRCQCSGQLLQH
jgi:hypothetical protein